MREGLEKFTELIYREIKRFPGVMLDNDYKTDWKDGATYTFQQGRGTLLNYGKTLLIYQELEVLKIKEDGTREKIGKTLYTNYIEEGQLLGAVQEYENSPEYQQGALRGRLKEAMEKKIREFGKGKDVEGIKFVTNDPKVLLGPEDVLKAILESFRERIENFFVDILVAEDFEPGIYGIDIETIEVAHSVEKGWEILLVPIIVSATTKEKREIDVIYTTGVREEEKTLEIGEIRKHVVKEVQKYAAKHKVSTHLGVEFRFMNVSESRKSVDIYKKIRGDKESIGNWSLRFVTAYENNKELLRELTKGVKTAEGLGYLISLKTGHVVAFSDGGIVLSDGREVYIKKEMNLQEGLKNLSMVMGKNQFTLEVMKTYDYRTRIQERGGDING